MFEVLTGIRIKVIPIRCAFDFLVRVNPVGFDFATETQFV